MLSTGAIGPYRTMKGQLLSLPAGRVRRRDNGKTRVKRAPPRRGRAARSGHRCAISTTASETTRANEELKNHKNTFIKYYLYNWDKKAWGPLPLARPPRPTRNMHREPARATSPGTPHTHDTPRTKHHTPMHASRPASPVAVAGGGGRRRAAVAVAQRRWWRGWW